MNLALVVGTRPNIIKAASLVPALRAAGITVTVINTSQHSDEAMSGQLYRELGISPDVNLPRPEGDTSAERFASMLHYLTVCFTEIRDCPSIMGLLSDVAADAYRNALPRFDLVMVVGDCDSTLAGALAAKKCGLKVAHVEAGLRASDAVQENLNRRAVDSISDMLLTSEAAASDNIYAEGGEVFEVGNVMIDALVANFKQATAEPETFDHLGLTYAVLTVHRAENTSDREGLRRIFMAIGPVLDRMPVVFPVHPRTWKLIESCDFDNIPNLKLIDPLGYLGFIKLLAGATVVLTDSGGVQEETTALGIPCLTLRTQTERPATVTDGTNELVGFDAQLVRRHLDTILRGEWKTGRGPELWDGHAAERIAQVLVSQAKAVAVA